MSNLSYPKEELEILDFIESENPDRVHNIQVEIKQLRFSVKNKLIKRKSLERFINLI